MSILPADGVIAGQRSPSDISANRARLNCAYVDTLLDASTEAGTSAKCIAIRPSANCGFELAALTLPLESGQSVLALPYDKTRTMNNGEDLIVVALGAVGCAALYQLTRSRISAIEVSRCEAPHAARSSIGKTPITCQAIGESDVDVLLVKHSHGIWRELQQVSSKKLLAALDPRSRTISLPI